MEMMVDSSFAAHALPTPSNTPYTTPSKGPTQLSSRPSSSSPFTNSSPIPSPPEADSFYTMMHENNDEDVPDKRSSLDPRRFTSDLDNSLIGQIHTLRLELENKNAMLETLEESLHQSKIENGQLKEDFDTQVEETRSVQRQMHILENGTMSALGDMGKERDHTVENLREARKRLDISKKKVRSQEEDTEKLHILWEKEKQNWDHERRIMERKVHVAETRLRTMVEEVIAGESKGKAESELPNGMEFTVGDAWNANNIETGSEPSNSRTASRLSIRSNEDFHEMKDPSRLRSSRLSGLHGMGGSKISGLSLAEELEGQSDENADYDEDDGGLMSPNALPEENPLEPERYSEDQKARKMMGLSGRDSQHSNGDSATGQHSLGIIMDYVNPIGKTNLCHYKDSATQFSPPPSPFMHTKQPLEMVADSDEKTGSSKDSALLEPERSQDSEKISIGCQTEGQSIFAHSSSEITRAGPTQDSVKLMASASTQTSEDAASLPGPAPTRSPPFPSDIPVIAIHPPGSRPSSSHTNVVLPPRTKNAGCQATRDMPRTETRSTSMQTEEIRIDKRSVQMPPPQQLSRISSQPVPPIAERRSRVTQPIPAKIPRRNFKSPPPMFRNEPPPASPPLPSLEDSYPGQNDNGPLNDKQQSSPLRPIRSESMFAGFDDTNDEDTGMIMEDISDDEPADFVPIKKTLSKVKDSWKLIPQSGNVAGEGHKSASGDDEGKSHAEFGKAILQAAQSGSTATSKTSTAKQPGPPVFQLGAVKPKNIRRTALVSSGATAHLGRARSPSAPNVPGTAIVAPPFPVPTRSSSRRIPLSASEGAASPSPYTTSFFTARRGAAQIKPPAKQKRGLRKTQSAAVVSKPSNFDGLPPLPSISTLSIRPPTPKTPPAARNQFILPLPNENEQVKQEQNVFRPRSHAGEASIETSSDQTSVVDAIAQTMVGEWMWKYVRKRTSFGITESAQAEFESGRLGENTGNGGIRHKRWVWLAPYERSVIWSGKQPTSGPALLGKGGRKLTIQSVLDVKDDTPMPKGSGVQQVFDRSILILTPQRALKFTAVSQERHYIWLTALSFLSQPDQGIDELASPPPESEHSFPRPPSREPVVSLRRTPMRDSIRVAKSKSRPSIGPHSLSSPPAELELPPLTTWEAYERPSEEAAEPPQVPRMAAHARKRSSTGPRSAPLSSFQSFPNTSLPAASSFSLNAPTAREKYDKYVPSSHGHSGPFTRPDSISRRVTAEGSVVPNNFFDAVGTVRMEAFIDRSENVVPGRKKGNAEKGSHRTREGRKKNMAYWGVADSIGSSSMASQPRSRVADPFRGF